jgi:putative ABC transport system substrate-binding protein
MRRRDLVAGLAAAAVPARAVAQPAERQRRVGILMGAQGADDLGGQKRIETAVNQLRALGWEQGRNLQLDIRWAAGDIGRIATHAAELVQLAPDAVLVSSTPAVAAVARATKMIPIVCAGIVDPVGLGYVASLARPGGNVTGFLFVNLELVGKWPDILKEAAPSVSRAAFLFNPDTVPFYVEALRLAAPSDVALSTAAVKSVAEIEAIIAALARTHDTGLIIPADAFTTPHFRLIASLTQRHRLPSLSVYREYAVAGGLMSYGPDPREHFRGGAAYVDRILRGASPADLPMQAPMTYLLTLNARAAHAFGLTIPPSLLARADEVIE